MRASSKVHILSSNSKNLRIPIALLMAKISPSNRKQSQNLLANYPLKVLKK
jgi:hypothetical protein